MSFFMKRKIGELLQNNGKYQDLLHVFQVNSSENKKLVYYLIFA